MDDFNDPSPLRSIANIVLKSSGGAWAGFHSLFNRGVLATTQSGRLRELTTFREKNAEFL